VLEAPGRLALQPRPLRAPGRLEARVRVLSAGICGTDLALVSGDYPVDLPLVPGHEWVGVVEAVGEGVIPEMIGARVVGEINYTCRSWEREPGCAACDRDLDNHCVERVVQGIIRADGAWATDLVLPAGNLHAVPTGVKEEHAVLVEPLAAAIQTFELAPVFPGDHVVVLGAGRLGALIAQVAQLRGARVIVVSRSPETRKRAKKLGARHVLPADAELPHAVRALTGPLGADLVVEATGSPDGLRLAQALVRPRGTIALKTTCGLTASLDATRAVVDEVQISTSRCGPFAKAIGMLRDEKLKLDALIAGRFPLTKVHEAIEAARGGGKILLNPSV
jgi:threonine dehydrogenase-like Zn-dependent dehydrogenase